MNILLICALDVWSLDRGAGAPTLERTLRAYAERGHTIDAVMPDIGANHFYRPMPRHPAAGGQRTGPLPPPLRLRRGGRGERLEPESRPQIPGVVFHTFHMPSLRDLSIVGERGLPAPVEKFDQKARFALAFPWVAARRAEKLLRQAAASGAYDVLYAYEVHAVLAARLLRRRSPAARRLPLVTRFQGTVMHPALTDTLLYYRRYEEALALKTPAGLIVMTDDGTRGDDVLSRLNPTPKERVKFWRNGLDLDRLRPASDDERRAAREALAIPDGAFVMLTASRLAAWKRIDRAVRALPKVRAWVPGAMLLVVGDGEERARLEALARELGVAAQVRFAGSVPQPDVARHMHAADVFLAVTDLSNVGNPLLEAMACGMCVVAVDAGDTRDLIADGRTGRLVEAAQRSGIVRPIEERLADLLVSLAGDAAQRLRLADGAAAYAREHFWTWDARMAAEVAAVEALVQKASSPAFGHPLSASGEGAGG